MGNNKNMQRLGATLANRMKQTSNAAVPITIDLGIVNGNLSITPDSLRVPIPKGDYMVNLMLTGPFVTSTSGTDEPHSHSLPSSFRGLNSGDRILILWCGNEPIVVAVIVSS